MEKDTVLMIAATPFFSDRGSHIRIYSEITHLQPEYQVVLATYSLGKTIPGIQIFKTISAPFYKKISPGFSWHKIYLDPLLFFTSLKVFINYKPRIIHAHQYESLLIAFLIKICTFSRVKILFDCQGSLYKEIGEYHLKKSIFRETVLALLMIIENILLRIPNYIICSSQNCLKYLVRTFNINLDTISLVEDGYDEKLFNPNTLYDKNDTKEKLSIPRENKVIIYTGSMERAKGVSEYLEAVPSLIPKHPDWTFLFIGYGSVKEFYEKKYHHLVKTKNIVFLDQVSYFDLPRYIDCANLAIDPKRRSTEASGKLINYLASGVRAAAFEVPYSELRNAVFIINSFSDLEAKLNAPHNKILHEKLESFSWKQKIKDLKKVYNLLLS